MIKNLKIMFFSNNNFWTDWDYISMINILYLFTVPIQEGIHQLQLSCVSSSKVSFLPQQMEQKRIRAGQKRSCSFFAHLIILYWKKTSSSGLSYSKSPSSFFTHDICLAISSHKISPVSGLGQSVVPFHMGTCEYLHFHPLLWKTLRCVMDESPVFDSF